MKLKRYLSLLLVLCLLVGMLPMVTFATEIEEYPVIAADTEQGVVLSGESINIIAEGTCGENASWTLSEDGTLFICGQGRMANYYDWDDAPWYGYGERIQSVIIDEGITSIGDTAFYDCDNLTSITIPNSVTSIGDNAFCDCDNLTSITIPDSVTSIGNYAFYDCDSLTSITIPDSVTSIGNSAFYDCDSLISIVIPDSVTSIGNYAFEGCNSLTSIVLPDGITSIGSYAFSWCSNLISITIPDSVTSIGNYAFRNCSSLTSIVIPDSVTSIGNSAFYYCSSLTSIVIPDSVTSIGSSAFENCSNLYKISFEGNAPTIGSSAFGDVTATAYYPAGNATWDSAKQNYGGSINWVAVEDLVGLEIVSVPADGVAGKEPDFAGLCVELVYSNGAKVPAGLNKLDFSDIDMSTPGRKTVVVSCGEFSAEFIYPVHEYGEPGIVLDPSIYPESDHNYWDDIVETQTLTWPNANGLILTFSEETKTELSCDYIYIYDGLGNQIAKYTGTQAAGVTVEVPGDTVNIRLTSDGGITDYGYSFAQIATKESIIHPGEVITIEPTCTEEGSRNILCEICEEVVGTPIPALGHDYDTVITGPTAETYGYTTYTCTRCGDSYKGNLTGVNAIAQGICGERVSWALSENGTLFICGQGRMTDYNGDDAPWYGYRDLIQSVIIDDGITSIGEYAFQDCYNLTSITIPDGVNSIGYSAFYDCYNLTSIVIPDSVTSIESSVFRYCSSLARITLPDSVTSIGGSAFEYCSSLTSITLPDSVTSIESSAFRYCSSLARITLPDSVTSIEYETFYGCSSLISVVIPDSVTSIGEYAFYDCDSLTSIVIPDSVTSIGYGAFLNCTSLTSIVIPNSVTSISHDAFAGCRSLVSITIPDSITSIESETFSGCSSLTSITIPDSVTSIGSYAFSGCSSLTSITIPDSVTSIGQYAFEKCSNLYKISFEGNAPTIGNYAFKSVTATATYPAGNTTWSSAKQNYGGSINWVAVEDLIGLEIVSAPVGGVVGKEPDFSGLCVDLIYSNGARVPAGLSELAFSNIDMSTPGRKTVVVSCGEFSAEFIYPVHEYGEPGIVLDPSIYPESAHNYSNNSNQTKTLTWPGANGLILTFSEATYTESGCDYIYIYDEYDNEIARYTGNGAAGVTVEVPGDTVKIRLTSDGSVTNYGYSFAKIATKESIIHPGEVITIEPTCTEDGSNKTICEICGLEQCEEIPATGHNYEGEESRTPTCTVAGEMTYTCTGCGDAYTEEIPTISHNYESKESRAPTCTIAGEMTYTCTGCGDVYTEEIPATGHHYERVENLEFICTICGYLDIKHAGGSHVLSANGKECELCGEVCTASGTCGENARWALYKDGSLAITGTGSMYDYSDSRCPWKKYRTAITSITVQEGITSIGDYSFYKCGNLASIVIPDSVTSIGNSAFSRCINITSITIPDSVTSIGSYAFYNCSSLTSITIPDSVTSIGEYAFKDCSGLTSVTIPDSVTSIGKGAFQACNSLVSITIPDSITKIERYTFLKCSGLESVTLPAHLSAIGYKAFYECSSLKSIAFPESLTSVGGYAFASCSSLESIELPDSLTRINYGVFSGCSSLTSVTFSDSLTSIGDSAFAGCSSLTSIEFPASLTFIDEAVFAHCSNLTEIVFLGNAPTISSISFQYVTANAYYPTSNNTWTDYYKQNYGGALTWVGKWMNPHGKCGENLTWTLAEDGLLTISGTGKMDDWNYDFWAPWYGYREMIKTVVLEEGVSSIGHYAFYECSGLVSVNLPNGITSIGDSAFSGCSSLTSVDLPDSLTSIEWFAFSNCSNLASIDLPDDLTSVGNSAFYGCNSLVNIELPIGISSIGEQAFFDCRNVTSITFAGDAPRIGYEAFYNVTANAYYPAGNDTWTHAAKQNYGGNLTWIAACPDHQYADPAYIWSDDFVSCTATRSCINPQCEEVKREKVRASIETRAATCEEEGKTVYIVMFTSDVFTTQTKERSIPALGHDCSYTVTAEPDLANTGLITGICSRCSHQREVELPCLNVEDYAYEVTLEPTLTQLGAGVYTWKETAYGTFSFTVTLDKLAPELEELTVATNPDKTVYRLGEPLDTTGLALQAAYSDGSIRTVTSGYRVSELDSSSPGEKTITVNYEGRSTTFQVTVQPMAETDPQILVSNSRGVLGQKVNVAISLKNNPGLASMRLTVGYDPNVMELVSVTDAGKLGNACHSDNYGSNPYTLTWENDLAREDFVIDGEIVTLTFLVAEDAPEGSTAVAVSYTCDNYDIFNAVGEEVWFATVDGSVEVVDALLGDVNSDGKVNTQDRMILSRYLAKWVDYPESIINMVAADVNCDGRVNAEDRLILTRHLAAWTGYETLGA